VISYKMARRSFLRGCGGAAALLVPMLRSVEARAAGAAAPLRFLVIHHPLGTQIDRWRPAAAATTTTFTLPANSAPFAPLQSKMVMIDGLKIVAATRVQGGPDGANTHEGGIVALMTGQPTLGRIGQQDHAAGGASIDQIFLAKSPLLGGKGAPAANRTPFGSLQLAADIRSDRDEVAPRILSYLDPVPNQTNISQARQPLYPETQPLNVFSRIFGGPLPGGGTPADVTRLMAQKKSVLDFMRADLTRLRTLVPASETVKLDAQADAIRQLEATIQASLGVGGGPACTKPTMPPSFQQTGTGAAGSLAPSGGSHLSGLDYYIPGDPNNHPHQTLGRLQLSMIRAAFACDLVRVATFMWSAGTNWVVFPGNFNGGQLAGNPQSSPHHPPSHTTDVNTVSWLAQIDTWYALQTSQALQEFQSTTDSDGNSLLDNTVVSYVTEVGRAYDHDQRNVPYLVFGGKNTGVQGGKFLKVTDGHLPNVEGGTGNRPTNDVWLALAPVFGITNMTGLGASTQYQGPLPGLIG
jgi:hypothetical protein